MTTANQRTIPAMPDYANYKYKYLLTLNLSDYARINTGEILYMKGGRTKELFKRWSTYTDSEKFDFSHALITEEFRCYTIVYEKSPKTQKGHVHLVVGSNDNYKQLELFQKHIHETYVPKHMQYRTPLQACLDIKYLRTEDDLKKAYCYLFKAIEDPWFNYFQQSTPPEYKVIDENLIAPIIQDKYICFKCGQENDKEEVKTTTLNNGINFYECQACLTLHPPRVL